MQQHCMHMGSQLQVPYQRVYCHCAKDYLNFIYLKPFIVEFPYGNHPPMLGFSGLAYQGKKDIVFRFIIEYSSLRDFYWPLGNNNNNNNRSILI
jgi:hypothetical protein